METTALNTGLTFGEPVWLWALLLVPALGGLFLWAQSKRKSLLALVVAPRLRDQLAAGVSPVLRGLRAGLVLLALALAVLALAEPRMGEIERQIKTHGRDVIFAIDTSRSMLATDVAPTRLARAKLLTLDMVRLLQGDRVGIVAFAGSAFLQAPLTLDYNAVRSTLDELDTNVIPRGGTDIAAAINSALEAFGKAEGTIRALVIMTDGEELTADGVASAKKAKEQGVRIFTVGIGSAEGSLIPIETDEGRRDYVRDSEGKPVQSKLDAKRLTEIAEATGGFYAPLTPDVAQFIFRKGIEPMAAHDTGMLSARRPIEQYQWPLGAAIVCLVAWVLLGEGRGRRRLAALSRTAVVAAALVLVAPEAGFAAATGLEQYQKGDYSEALKSFEESTTTTPEKEKALFDAGASAYKMKDYAKAVDHFTGALLSNDSDLRASASYNLGNALVRRGEQAKSDDSKEKDWKDALTHYDATLKIHPSDADAKANRDLVKKLLDDLKKKKDEQKQQQQKQDKNQQNKDQKKDDQQKQDQQNKDQQKSDQQKQDQQKQDQQGKDQQKQDQQKQDQQKQDQQGQDQQGQDQPKQDQQGQEQQNDQSPSRPQIQDQNGKPQPTPQPTQGEKKEGDLNAQPDQPKPDENGQGEGQAAQPAEEKDGEMSENQARALLRAMQGEEKRVRLLERQQNQDVIKDW